MGYTKGNQIMEKETNLSEKIVDRLSHIPTKDVREAVLRLKDKVNTGIRRTLWSDESVVQLLKEIDEIFGKKLT